MIIPRLSRVRFTLALLVFVCIPSLAQAARQDTADKVIILPPPAAVSPSSLKGVEWVVAAPGEDYSAWFLHRFLFGDLNRDLWKIPFRVPVLRMDTMGGGLKVSELSGGKQTLGVRLDGKDGNVYQFRSLVKDPRRAMPKLLHKTPVGFVSKDQMAAQFPLSPLVVSELVEAVDVLVAKPTLVIMPDDERLGEYRDFFVGRMGWIEQRPEEREDNRPGFGGGTKFEGTYDLYEELIENPLSYVNAQALLRVRLVDLLVGDWDRHSDQWRWARFKEETGRERWEPIARDRDWAFAHIDGVLRPFVSIYYPQYVGFDDDYMNVYRLSWASQRVDRVLLAPIARAEFMKVAGDVVAILSDSVLRKSVAVLPPEYRAAGDELFRSMRIRRDSLLRAAGDFYDLLAKDVAVVATDSADEVTVTTSGDSMRVQLHATIDGKSLLRYDRMFHENETDEVRLYLLDGDDRVVIRGAGELPLKLRIATGDDDDEVIDSTGGNNLYIYNGGGDDEVEAEGDAFFTKKEYLTQDTLRTAARIWNTRDWGSAWLLLPSVDHQSDIGLLLGAKLTRESFGFGQQRCQGCWSFEWLGAPRTDAWVGNVVYDRMVTAGGWWWANSFEMHSGRPVRFYGFGNDIIPEPNEGQFTGFRQTIELRSGLRYKAADELKLDAGITYRASGNIRDGGEIFDELSYGVGEFRQIGVRTALDFDTRDNRSFPTKGAVVRLSADYHPEMLDITSSFASARASARWYGSLNTVFDPALHLRVVGEKVWGDAPFGDIPWLGGTSSLPGFSRGQFRGDAMASGSALLRAKAFSLGKIDIGLHGLSSVGRVWQPGEESSTWHRANGGGLWIHLQSIKRTLSVTMVKGDRTRTYFDFGFIF